MTIDVGFYSPRELKSCFVVKKIFAIFIPVNSIVRQLYPLFSSEGLNYFESLESRTRDSRFSVDTMDLALCDWPVWGIRLKKNENRNHGT